MTDRFRNTAQPDRDWWETLWPEPGSVVEALGVEPGDRAVDICAGDGLFTLPLAEQAGETVYALDLDSTLLDELAERAAGIDGTVETIEADARDVDAVLPERVEFALLANTFHGISEPASLCRAVETTLTDDGRFAVVNWHDRPRAETTVLDEPRGPPTPLRLSPEATAEACTAAGFERETTVDLPPYHYGVVFRRA